MLNHCSACRSPSPSHALESAACEESEQETPEELKGLWGDWRWIYEHDGREGRDGFLAPDRCTHERAPMLRLALSPLRESPRFLDFGGMTSFIYDCIFWFRTCICRGLCGLVDFCLREECLPVLNSVARVNSCMDINERCWNLCPRFCQIALEEPIR